MDTNLFLEINIENDVVAHIVRDQRNNAVISSGICTNLMYALDKVKAKFGELDFDLYLDGKLCI